MSLIFLHINNLLDDKEINLKKLTLLKEYSEVFVKILFGFNLNILLNKNENRLASSQKLVFVRKLKNPSFSDWVDLVYYLVNQITSIEFEKINRLYFLMLLSPDFKEILNQLRSIRNTLSHVYNDDIKYINSYIEIYEKYFSQIKKYEFWNSNYNSMSCSPVVYLSEDKVLSYVRIDSEGLPVYFEIGNKKKSIQKYEREWMNVFNLLDWEFNLTNYFDEYEDLVINDGTVEIEYEVELQKKIFSTLKGFILVDGTFGLGKTTLVARVSKSYEDKYKSNLIRYYVSYNSFTLDTLFFYKYLSAKLSEILPELKTEIKSLVQKNQNLLNFTELYLQEEKLIIIMIDDYDLMDEMVQRDLNESSKYIVLIAFSKKKLNIEIKNLESHLIIPNLSDFDVNNILNNINIPKNKLESLERYITNNPLYLKTYIKESNYKKIPYKLELYFNHILQKLKNTCDEEVFKIILLLSLNGSSLNFDIIKRVLQLDLNYVVPNNFSDYFIWIDLNVSLFSEVFKNYIKILYNVEIKKLKSKYLIPFLYYNDDYGFLNLDNSFISSLKKINLQSNSNLVLENDVIELRKEYDF